MFMYFFFPKFCCGHFQNTGKLKELNSTYVCTHRLDCTIIIYQYWFHHRAIQLFTHQSTLFLDAFQHKFRTLVDFPPNTLGCTPFTRGQFLFVN